MPGASSTLKYLYDLQLFGIKLGLRNIRGLLEADGNPQRRFATIHIAGTNGKGSTSALIASVLAASGYRTGLYTSPHLRRFNERIRINGREISDAAISGHARRLRPAIRALGATFFEATTAIAFGYFAEEGVEVAVVETGLGGRFDATNVIEPLVSVITNIDLDHTEHLGRTYASIAYEKAGIIKRGVPCVTATARPEALAVLRRVARSCAAPLTIAQRTSSARILGHDLAGTVLTVSTARRSYRDLRLPLAGGHQITNLRLALLALEEVKARGFNEITTHSVGEGVRTLRRRAGFHGRLEVLGGSPPVIVDVGHNPAGIGAAVCAVTELIGGEWIALFGVMSDKEYLPMVRSIGSAARLTIAVAPHTGRARSSADLCAAFHRLGCRAYDGKSVREGLRLARNEARRGEAIVVLGSHYVVGEAMEEIDFRV